MHSHIAPPYAGSKLRDHIGMQKGREQKCKVRRCYLVCNDYNVLVSDYVIDTGDAGKRNVDRVESINRK